MYKRPQVSNKVRKDDDDSRDLRERFGDAIKCGYEPPSKESFYLHRRNCSLCSEYALEIGDYVRCPYCVYSSNSIRQHLKTKHLLTDEYIEQNKIKTISENYSLRIGQAVRNAINSSEHEIKRRSKLLADLNKTEQFRKRASETARITSSRKDIQEKRSIILSNWRSANPDEFKNKCWQKMLSSDKKWKKTKPEIFMTLWLEENYSGLFEWGKMMRSNLFKENGMSDRKQIDFRTRDKEVFIEIDGPFHFTNLAREKIIDSEMINNAIERSRNRDSILEKIILEKKKILIRIGYGVWCNSTGRIKEAVLERIANIIDSRIFGVYKLGEIYGESNCL